MLSARLQQLTAAFPAVVLSGARQVCKTTLLQRLFNEHDYVVFDASLDQENARREPELLLKNHLSPGILDEIRYALELVAAIKRAIDRDPGRTGRFLLTGSQQWQVLNSLAESLAGRPAFHDLSGFSLRVVSRPKGYLADTGLASTRKFPRRGHSAGSLCSARCSRRRWTAN